VDDSIWNPAIDSLIPARYSAADLSGKRLCRAELLTACGFAPNYRGPVIGMICRLTEQKGIDLVVANREFFARNDCRLIVLGAGSPRLEEEMRRLASDEAGKVFVCVRLDEKMSHLIEAGSDYFLMPSLFEPCGLNQMYSQVYGTIPIVSRVGGLADTVIDADVFPDSGTGLVCEPSRIGVLDALERALRLFSDPARLARVQRRGMEKDFSWRKAAAAYERLYNDSL